MNTPSPESMAEVMTGIKKCCDLAHNGFLAIKNPAHGGADEHQDQFVDLKKFIGCRQCISVPCNSFIDPNTVLIQYPLLKLAG